MPPAHELVIDIETAPVKSFTELPPSQQHYLMERHGGWTRDGQTADERLNLTPLYGKIIAIGLWLASEERTCIMFEGAENAWIDDIDIADKVYIGDEASMLDAFWKICAKYPGRVVTWGGRTFDVPFLYLRSAINGVAPSRNIMGVRYAFHDHCDLYELVTFFGASRVGSYSLQAYAHAFGIEHPGLHTGRSIAEIYEAGVVEEIAEFCMHDVRATYQLYERMKPTIGVVMGTREVQR